MMMLDMGNQLDRALTINGSVRCFVNGGEVTDDCQAASEEEGWALCVARDMEGNVRVIQRRSGKREIGKCVIFGDVRFDVPYYVRRIAEHRYQNGL